MSMNDPSMNPQWPQQPPPKTGMKGSTKVLIGLAIAFGLLCVLCCGIFGGLGYYMKSAVSQDPQTIRQVTESLVRMEIPNEFKPTMSIDMKMFTTMVVWGDFGPQGGQNGLVIASFPMVPKDNQAQAHDQLEQSLRQQGKGKQPLVDRKSEDRSFKVRGQEAHFLFTHGKDATTKAPQLEVAGTFEGAKGMTMLMVRTDPKNEEKIAKMIESIK